MLRHEKIAILIAITGLVCLIVSVLPGGYEVCTGILQGIGTGLFTGVAILFVSGTKSYEINEKKEAIDALRKYQKSIEEIYKTEFNTDNKETTVKCIDDPLMFNYCIYKLKIFLDEYCNNEQFDRIASDCILQLQRYFKEAYYEQIRELSDEFRERIPDYHELLKYSHKIIGLYDEFCEAFFDTDIDISIEEQILEYKKEISKLNHSRI